MWHVRWRPFSTCEGHLPATALSDTGGRSFLPSQGPGKVHNDTGRTWLGPFIDQHPTLCALLDDPRINGAFATMLGDDFTYWGSDGNFFAGQTGWHSDSDWGVSELPSRGHHGERPRGI